MGESAKNGVWGASLSPDSSEVWAILEELRAIEEPQLRHILRPHVEVGFDSRNEAKQMKQRQRLDVALGELTRLEIGFQLGIFTEAERAVPKRAELQFLFDNSEALLRYVTAYSYFGVRFLAGRIAPPPWFESLPEAQLPLTRNSNERPFALKIPAPLNDMGDLDQNAMSFLGLPETPDILEALQFLDGFTRVHAQTAEMPQPELEEPKRFELWLKGLLPETDKNGMARFATLASGLTEWAMSRAEFYSRLQKPVDPAAALTEGSSEGFLADPKKPMGGWIVTSPAAARFGLADVYWIARLLRADVSDDATVSYSNSSWLHLLRFQAALEGDTNLQELLRTAEDVLRSVLDFVCDLVQNAVEITREREQDAFDPLFRSAARTYPAKWRQTFDEELKEIDRQREHRRFRVPDGPDYGSAAGEKDYWSERLKTGHRPHNLVGLAFSGGGIRSATFNLGVLQALQEADLLRYIDYLSVVSGGGFIGGWLAANVKGTAHWLGRLTSWDESVAFLRRYSNYLAPRTGVFSPDTWTMWGIWSRNALLVQLTAFAWVCTVLLLAFLGEHAFIAAGESRLLFGHIAGSAILALLMTMIVCVTLFLNLRSARYPAARAGLAADRVQLFAVIPSWIASFLVAALLWADATDRSALADQFCGLTTYHLLLTHAWRPWSILLGFVGLALTGIAYFTLFRQRWQALLIGPLCTGVLYLQLCGIMKLLFVWAENRDQFDWYAFTVGPALVLGANTVSIILFIGFCGKNSEDSVREWWTRFGSWLAIYAAGYLAVATAAVFGPHWIFLLYNSHSHWSFKLGASATWIGTIIGGLLAGNSSKTNGAHNKSAGLEFLAKAGGLLFIVAAVLGTAVILHLILLLIGEGPLPNYWLSLHSISLSTLGWVFAATLTCGLMFSWFFEINVFSLNQFYRNRLVRCYLGATRWAAGFRKPQPFIDFDRDDDFKLGELRDNFRGPFPIFNCALNLSGGSDLAVHTRQSASFSLTPLRCGSDRRKLGYAPTAGAGGSFADGVTVGQAMAISGAAASPNMGYNTSPLVALLLTLFNVRLGWWFPNPGQRLWKQSGLGLSLYYLLRELTGSADEDNFFVNVSDGGHFENLGVYELVRRRCKVIIAADAECDEFLQFGSMGNLVRICETDFGARIEIDLSSIRQQQDGVSLAHCAIGKITYSNGSIGNLIYLKASVSGDESVGITQYRSVHPSFPHESTANQFFSEDQFESYRKLGQHVVEHSFRGTATGTHPVRIAEMLADVLAPVSVASNLFLKHTKTLDKIWERFRLSRDLDPLMAELMATRITGPSGVPIGVPKHEELCAGLELIQLMENVVVDLRLDDFWEHPDNRGWAILFMRWARSPLFRAIWVETRRTFGIRFEYFCEARLGLPRDEPIVRV